jgi:hypothetical protein
LIRDKMLPNYQSMFGRELAPGAHQIGPTRWAIFQGGYSRSYLFEGNNGLLTLVDTGWDTKAKTILRYIDDIGRSPAQIEYIALTHSHRSHLGGLARLVELSDATVRCHETEAPVVEGRRRAHPIRLWPPLPVRLYLFRIISRLPILAHVPCAVDKANSQEHAARCGRRRRHVADVRGRLAGVQSRRTAVPAIAGAPGRVRAGDRLPGPR